MEQKRDREKGGGVRFGIWIYGLKYFFKNGGGGWRGDLTLEKEEKASSSKHPTG